MDTSNISDAKEIQKDILAKLLAVCEENNLRVFAEGGTLIGAVRDAAFISYDDDIDTAMLREDYDKLMEIGPSCFEYPYFFQSAYTDEGYYRPHIQIRRTDTCGALRHELPYVNFNQGIFIDVFPYDGVPDDTFFGRIHWYRIQVLKKLMSMLYSPIPPKNPIKRIVKNCLRPLNKVIKREKCYKHFDNVCKRYSKTSDTLTLISFNSKYRQRLLKREWFAETIYCKFDEMILPCPSGYDGILTSKYGDWRTPSDSGTFHGDVVFDVNRSYKEVVKDRKEERND